MTDKTPKKPAPKKASDKASKEPKAAKVETISNDEKQPVTVAEEPVTREPFQEKNARMQPLSVFAHLASFIWFLIKLPFWLLLLPLKILAWPFRRKLRKWFGPPPLVFGAVPISHE